MSLKIVSNSVESCQSSYSKKCQDHVRCCFAYKLICVDDEFTKPIIIFRSANGAYKFIEPIFKEFKYCKKVMKKHFNKNSFMSEKGEQQFQSSM